MTRKFKWLILREPGKGGRPSKYCCKLCANEASRTADGAPAAVATHTAVAAFTAEAGQIRARLHQRDAELAAEREDLRRLDERLEQVWEAIAAQLAQAETSVRQAEQDAEQARTSMRAAHAARQPAEQERDTALRGRQEALNAQREAEEHRDRIHSEARADSERLDVRSAGSPPSCTTNQALPSAKPSNWHPWAPTSPAPPTWPRNVRPPWPRNVRPPWPSATAGCTRRVPTSAACRNTWSRPPRI
ncbi:hypothetical protein [Nonomuraea jabiensis]|uniref:Uncharacterized protein n=1 Tax=Nonomuraea jabiensis TaxID=882448 RepID=A0A7W9GDJ8_9ACTN|nr:hypothetical protein [Nonomuraea jabiensis]MBB5781835.1 hypothetical protein [Nonomuraea jabiensis]